MLCSLLVVVLSLVFAPSESCTNNCKYLYQNPKGEEYNVRSSFFKAVDKGSVTGLITLHFDFFDYGRPLAGEYGISFTIDRRYSDSGLNLPLAIYFNITGRVRLAGYNPGCSWCGSYISPDSRHPIQIADTFTDYLRLYIGTAGSAKTVDFNYDGPSSWNEFQNAGNILSNTTEIDSSGWSSTVYKYISACSITTPEICGSESEVSNVVILDQPYDIECVGSGAPFLDVTWSMNGSEDLPEGATQNSTIHDHSLPDHKITSIIRIAVIKDIHLGTWKCTVTNKNLQSKASKVFRLTVPDLTHTVVTIVLGVSAGLLLLIVTVITFYWFCGRKAPRNSVEGPIALQMEDQTTAGIGGKEVQPIADIMVEEVSKGGKEVQDGTYNDIII